MLVVRNSVRLSLFVAKRCVVLQVKLYRRYLLTTRRNKASFSSTARAAINNKNNTMQTVPPRRCLAQCVDISSLKRPAWFRIILSTTTTAFGVTRAVLRFNLFSFRLARNPPIFNLHFVQRPTFFHSLSCQSNRTMDIFRLGAHDSNSREILVAFYWQLSILNQSKRFLLFYCLTKTFCFNMKWLTWLRGSFSTLVNTGFIFTRCWRWITKESDFLVKS